MKEFMLATVECIMIAGLCLAGFYTAVSILTLMFGWLFVV